MNKRVNILLVLILFICILFTSCKEATLNILNVQDDEINLLIDETFKIEYEKEGTKEIVFFESSDYNIVDIDEEGLITPYEEGSCDIIITCGNISKNLKITVTKKKYSITFLGLNNEIIEVQQVNENELPKSPTLPNVEGYRFIKWDQSFTKALEDKTYNAIYKKIINITYELNGGYFENENQVVTSVVSGSNILLPNVLKDNYFFLGWTMSDLESDKNYLENLSSTNDEDITVYAKYEKKDEVNMIYDYNGGYSEKALCDQSDISNAPSFKINNYNYNGGKYWDGKYTTDIFIGDKTCDPKATFSERFYIKFNKDYGLYQVVGHIASGASEWLNDADYVISISFSYNSFNLKLKPICNNINVGDMVAFSKDLKTATNKNPIKVTFYPVNTACQPSNETIKHNSEFVIPNRLGYKFVGWYKDDVKVLSPSELSDGDTVQAKWEELNPVTDISIGKFIDKLYTLDSFEMNARVVPSDAYFKDISYTSSDTNVVVVDKDGKIKAINKGHAVITITDFMHKVTISKEIEVVSKNCLTISLSDGYTGILRVGNSVTVTPKCYGEITNPLYEYTSSNPSVATIENGVIKGINAGLVDITIKEINSNISLTFGITVRNLPTEERIDKLLNILSNGNFAVVDVGNACLYNDGTERVYRSTYGSVNLFTFADYKVNTKYQSQAEASSSSHKSRSGLGDIEFVTVHDTATLTGTVDDIASYFSVGGGDSSIHYTVGNNEIYAVVPEKYIAYHAGDGTGTKFTWTKTDAPAKFDEANEAQTPTFGRITVENKEYLTVNGKTTTIVLPSNYPLTILGPTWKVEDGYYYIGGPLWSSTSYGYIGSRGGNNNSIGIEMCVNTSSDIYDTYQRTSQLVADILIRNNLDLTRVKMHNTWSGKNCPQVLIAGDYWDTFMKMVKIQYIIMKDYSDAKITFKSHNEDIVNEDGRVITKPEITTCVSYDITVEIGGKSKTITLNSIIPGTTCWEQWDGTYSAKTIWNNGKFKLDI